MPPRKKAKASAASTPLADVQPKTPQDSGPTTELELLNDAWADEQETQLFKSMMKWKPTGMHKHFRMISIHADMRSHGFATDDAPHTRIPGIWSKVASLYDLRALDEREDAYAFSEEPNPLDPDEAATIPDFELPEDEFGEMIWQQRFHRPESEPSSSPPTIPFDDEKLPYVPDMGMLNDLPDGIRSQQAESVAETTPTPKKGKNTRANKGAAKSGKAGKGQAAKNSKTQSAVSDTAEEEDEDDDEAESSEESEDTAPITRRTNRSKSKPQPPPKRTRKR
ncbi:CT20-domain-containing protein [Bimuria novae-zelandiae CBS 107.79]|uniref:CT20-domain-containing protein n=1 Tax=Bimuria novae-zelandiae CBS 107.79 TaxID=1447943 RepID=A0A6A5UUW7_9PLEO|nr:CT20-domain-containing protein [Bimuria novae-zelandiae CBS 107.79]